MADRKHDEFREDELHRVHRNRSELRVPDRAAVSVVFVALWYGLPFYGWLRSRD